MAIIRLIILVTVLGGLTLLLAQNFSPALPLIFLGVRTQPFPLAIWILFSVIAGAVTSLFVSSLFGLSGYFAVQQPIRAKSPLLPMHRVNKSQYRVHLGKAIEVIPMIGILKPVAMTGTLMNQGRKNQLPVLKLHR